MERKYYRQYENFEKIVPNSKEFPVLNAPDAEIVNNDTEVASKNILSGNFKLDDIIIIGILIMLLNEEEKDMSTILLLCLLLLSDYIF